MMKRVLFAVAVAAIVPGLGACNSLGRQPRLSDPSIKPHKLVAGDSPVITVKLTDRFDIVSDIEATLKEDPKRKFILKDDGVPPDKVAHDGIWSTQANVLLSPPPGTFTLEISAHNKKGEIIRVRTSKTETGPLTVTCPFSIEAPQQQ